MAAIISVLDSKMAAIIADYGIASKLLLLFQIIVVC